MTHPPSSIIITGSSSGIGYAVARTFLEHGSSVVLNGRDPERLAAAVDALYADSGAAPERLASVAGDISDPKTGEALVQMAVKRFGRVDVLVNNAGTFGVTPFTEVSEHELDGYLTGNLKGTFLTTQAAVREMKRAGKGCIVNIGTVLIDHPIGAVPASAALVSKGGVHALTKSLAAELAPDGIRVNLVAPGMVQTPLQNGNDPDFLGSVALLNRVGEAKEIADAVVYLAEAEFTTGHILNVDGGFVGGRA